MQEQEQEKAECRPQNDDLLAGSLAAEESADFVAAVDRLHHHYDVQHPAGKAPQHVGCMLHPHDAQTTTVSPCNPCRLNGCSDTHTQEPAGPAPVCWGCLSMSQCAGRPGQVKARGAQFRGALLSLGLLHLRSGHTTQALAALQARFLPAAKRQALCPRWC